MTSRDMYNSSGYLDMTAFLALRNIAREEKRRSKSDRRGKKRCKTAVRKRPAADSCVQSGSEVMG